MVTKEKRIKEVEARIYFLKKELMELNNELAVLKGTDDSLMADKNNAVAIAEKNCDRDRTENDFEESKCLAISEKLIKAMIIYKNFRKCGLKEKIVYQKVKGNFSTLYRYFDNNRFNHTIKFNIFLYDLNQSCKKGKYPKLNCLLETEKYDLEAVKAAVLEDLNEVMKCTTKGSNVYNNLFEFSEIVNNYKE